MRRLPFSYWREGSVYWAKFVSTDERPVKEHWPGLNDEDALEQIEFATWNRFAINNNNREEVAVYIRIIWSLLADREVLANAYYWTGDASKQVKQAGSVVRWQFEVDTEGPPGHAAIKGFTDARSSVQVQPPPSPHERWMRDKTLLFRIRDQDELAALLRSVLGDAAGEISIFGTTEARAHHITEKLRSEERPEIESLLEADDIFVDLGIGVDLGYNDSIVVASKQPIEEKLEPILQEAEKAISQYESRVNGFLSPEQAFKLIEQLAGSTASRAL